MFGTINNATSVPVDKLAIKLKSFVWSDCDEIFVFEMNDSQDRNFSHCQEHLHITKLFDIARQQQYNIIMD